MRQTYRLLFLLFIILQAGVFTASAQSRKKKPATKRQQTAPVVNQQTSNVDDGQEAVSVETSVVTVPVSVSDKGGKFVSGLTREKFHLSENGVEQEIAFFDDTEAPFTVALMLDMSNSTEKSLADIQKSAVAFLDQLRPRDKVMIVAFNKDIYQLTEATSDRAELEKQIYRTISGGTTSVYDALYYVGEKFRGVRGRKAIVLFSDGVDTSSQATYESSLQTARGLDSLIYTIRYETYNPVTQFFSAKSAGSQTLVTVTARGENLKKAYDRGTGYVKLIADFTGGRYFLADSPKRLGDVFSSIADELRRQYSIGYYPNEDASGKALRKIKVAVDVPEAEVRTRKAYVHASPMDEENK